MAEQRPDRGRGRTIKLMCRTKTGRKKLDYMNIIIHKDAKTVMHADDRTLLTVYYYYYYYYYEALQYINILWWHVSSDDDTE